jgi:hypothetical protein
LTSKSQINWGAILLVALLVFLFSLGVGIAYWKGYDAGEQFGVRTKVVVKYEREMLPPAYGQACSDMMEAAWGVLKDEFQPTDQERSQLLDGLRGPPHE